eukprot:4237893-Pyramimonas_sp.AAC.1
MVEHAAGGMLTDPECLASSLTAVNEDGYETIRQQIITHSTWHLELGLTICRNLLRHITQQDHTQGRPSLAATEAEQRDAQEARSTLVDDM